MVCDIIEHSWAASGRIEVKKGINIGIGMSKKIREATDILRDFLFAKVYNVQSAQEESEKARVLLRKLYAYLTRHVRLLPAEYRLHGDDKKRWVIDYIAGMTDLYAQKIADELSLL